MTDKALSAGESARELTSVVEEVAKSSQEAATSVLKALNKVNEELKKIGGSGPSAERTEDPQPPWSEVTRRGAKKSINAGQRRLSSISSLRFSPIS